MDKQEPSYTASKNSLWKTVWKNLPHDPAIPLPGIDSGDMESRTHSETRAHTFPAAPFTRAKHSTAPRSLQTMGEKRRWTHSMRYFSHRQGLALKLKEPSRHPGESV